MPSSAPAINYGVLTPYTPQDGTVSSTPNATPGPSPTPTPQSPFAGFAVADGANGFGAELYVKLAAERKGNFLFSPAGVETVLSMACAGAAGNTAQQMREALHFSPPVDKLAAAYAELLAALNNPAGKDTGQPAYQLIAATGMWGQRRFGFKSDFVLSLRKNYGAGMNEADFATPEEARKSINTWGAQQTRDRFRELIAKGVIAPQTHLVPISAIYFKSGWLAGFPKKATANAPFALAAGKPVDVPMMHLTKSFGYSEDDTLQMLELPYARSQLSMVVFLPKKADALAEMEKGLSAARIDKWIKGKKDAPVAVTLPRCTFGSDFLLADTLKGMGMTDAFDEGKADFTGMSPMEKLCIAQVVHKTCIAVDEDGTEGPAPAAAVAAPAGGAAAPELPDAKAFKADHPFFFLIRHNPTGQILFVGRLANPKGE